jgi:2-amino-4-hydroxy-6-hydroxymethyldihydropteridine diphosphokinase
VAESRVYQSTAVDYVNQPDFFNQVLEFKLPDLIPSKLINEILAIEKNLGRKRLVDKGPRLIDIDVLFYHTHKMNTKRLTVPHPRLFQRSFVLKPLLELPCYKILSRHFQFPTKEEIDLMGDAFPLP